MIHDWLYSALDVLQSLDKVDRRKRVLFKFSYLCVRLGGRTRYSKRRRVGIVELAEAKAVELGRRFGAIEF